MKEHSMVFKIRQELISESPINLMRKAGYFSLGKGREDGELSFIRPIQGGGYPRFHVILKTNMGKEIIFNIHLDQKKPSYKGSSAHSGVYDGPVMEDEAERIRKCIFPNS